MGGWCQPNTENDLGIVAIITSSHCVVSTSIMILEAWIPSYRDIELTSCPAEDALRHLLRLRSPASKYRLANGDAASVKIASKKCRNNDQIIKKIAANMRAYGSLTIM